MRGGAATSPAGAPPHADGPEADAKHGRPERTGRPRLGFLGLGWIGRARLQAVREADVAEVAALADPSDEAREAAQAVAGEARAGRTVEDLLEAEPDGIVIATPSALHARDAARALRAGVAVFCQKPVGRDLAECRSVVEAARAADRLLGVDLCYRRTRAADALRTLVRLGALGRVHSVDLTFHNAYGPDKPWFYRRSESGGGCLLDLGTHLVDLALWLLDETHVEEVRGRLLRAGAPLAADGDAEAVEDYATAELGLPSGAHARLACSWGLAAGVDAVISVHLWGTRGGAALRNVDGSYYDFVAERYDGTRRELLVEPPDAWGGRTLVSWCRVLADDPSYDPRVESVLEVARVLDALYGRPRP